MKAKLLFFVAEDRFFCSHFMARAKAAQVAGFSVVVLTQEGRHGDTIRNAGMRLIPLTLQRGSVNLWRELGVVYRVFRVYRQERPDLVHHVALKPIIYGSIVTRLLGMRAVINAPVGMGYVFSSGALKARFLRPVIRFLMHALLQPPGSKVIFENVDDLHAHVSNGSVHAADAVLIRGAGVDIDHFRPCPAPSGEVVVTLAARMLRDKGVEEFVTAARILKEKGCRARFRLAGAPDPGNPASLDEAVLKKWHADGTVEWLGHCDDMSAVWADTHVACLPSYREGLPKSLLEALACGLPVVTTDVPGCREVVNQGINGLLIPAKDSAALAAALQTLIEDAQLRVKFGAQGRLRAQFEFSEQIVVAATLDIYQFFQLN